LTIPVSCVLAVSLSLVAIAKQPAGHDGHKHKHDAEGVQASFTGELIDTACFVTSDGEAKGADHAECARECMASGVPAGILAEGAPGPAALLFLLTNPVPLAPYAGQQIKVEGKVFEGMHAMDVQKLWVKDGAGWKEIPLNDAHHKMGQGR
jgi:hypothetical protein